MLGVFERYTYIFLNLIFRMKHTSMRFIFSYLVLELMFEPSECTREIDKYTE